MSESKEAFTLSFTTLRGIFGGKRKEIDDLFKKKHDIVFLLVFTEPYTVPIRETLPITFASSFKSN